MYTVIAQRQIPAPVDRVWDFLTRPELLARWFADTPRLAPNEPCRFEFGDGDFFAGEVTEWDPSIVLGLRWRFVALGPEYEVRFSLLRRKGGTELSIQDRGAISVQEAECLRVGWSEFLMRLEKAIHQGGSARFAWRKAITFTARLREGVPEILATMTDAAWYPRVLGGAHAEVREVGQSQLRTLLRHDAWGVNTAIRVDLKQIRGVDYMLVAHEGWSRLADSQGEAERRRYVQLWLDAMAGLGAC